MLKKNKYILPVLLVISISALLMKKFTVPFHGFILIIVFDGLAVYYFLRAFTSEKSDDIPYARTFNFDVGSLAYGICSIAILYRLQYWNGWQRWISVAGVLFLIITIITLLSLAMLRKMPDRKISPGSFLKGNISWIYFIIVFPVVALTNPRTFHNLFNGTTYEQHVRNRYSLQEGTQLLERFRPRSENALKESESNFLAAVRAEKEKNYADALTFYNKSIDLNPGFAKAIYQRGRLKLTKLEISRDMAESAHDDFSRAIELDSSLAVAYFHRAVAHNYLDKKHRLPAQNDLRKAHQLDTGMGKDQFSIELLRLPPVDSTGDTTSIEPEEE